MAAVASAVEDRTHAYGRDIFARLDRRGPIPFTPAWLDDRLMQLTMGDEAVKVQLFRFIDALPNLKTSEDIAAHLREYLRGSRPTFASLDAASRRLVAGRRRRRSSLGVGCQS